MTILALSELRGPPTVGKRYLVPAIDYPWNNRRSIWPVLGPLHADAEFFDFPRAHYHIDPRFLTYNQVRYVSMIGRCAIKTYPPVQTVEPLILAVTGYPLSHRGAEIPRGRPGLISRRCRISTYTPGELRHDRVEEMRNYYGDPAEPIRLGDGRILCPHRKLELSTFQPDANGVVTCPLHGLRVQCGARP